MEQTNQPEPSPQPAVLKPTKKQLLKKYAVIVGGALVLLAVVGLLVWRARRMGYTKQFTIEGWHTLSSQSDDIAGLTKGDVDATKTTALAADLRKFDSTVKDQKVNLSLIPTMLNDGRALTAYGDFIKSMSSFSAQVASMSDDVTAITDTDVSRASDLAKAAKESSAATKERLGYLGEAINPSLFDVGTYLESLKKLSDAAKAKAAADAQSKMQQAAQAQLDQQLVELSVTGFMDGYVSADATKMKRYMTAAFAAEYDFNQLGTSQRQYVYPASYRIVTSTALPDGTHTCEVNVLNKYRNPDPNSADQYTLTQTFTLNYDTKTARWLINLEKTQ